MATSVESGGAVSVSMFDDPHLGRLPVAGLFLERYHDTLLQGFVLPAHVGADRCVYKLDLIWFAFNWRRQMTVATVWEQVFEVVLQNSSADLAAAELAAAACRKVFDEYSGKHSP